MFFLAVVEEILLFKPKIKDVFHNNGKKSS